MNNNDIIRRVRYILDLKDNQITKIFKHVETEVTEKQVNLWLKREEDEGYVELADELLIDFLDALIIEKRGRKEGPNVRFKQNLDNNLILMKLKIAFHLKAEDALAIMELAEFKISKHEFSALFRKKDHKHYRVCKNQMLRKFMKGLQIKYRGNPHQDDNKEPVVKIDNPPTSVEKKTLSRKPPSDKPVQNNSTQQKPAIEKSESKKTAASVWKIPSKKK